jgi:hypothetical protein
MHVFVLWMYVPVLLAFVFQLGVISQTVLRVGAIVAWLRVSTSKITGNGSRLSINRTKLRTVIGGVFAPAINLLEKSLRFEIFHLAIGFR